MNHYVNQNTLDLFKTPNPKFLDVFPQEEQLFYLKVTRIMVSFFLNNICPLLTVKSKRMGKEKRIEHLRARRLLLTRLAANRVHWPRNVGYTYSEAILYSYRMYYKKRQFGLDTVYLSVDILICPLFQLLELKKYPKGNIRPPNSLWLLTIRSPVDPGCLRCWLAFPSEFLMFIAPITKLYYCDLMMVFYLK